ncbi:PP2C family protein-serine/threonine phosphatase [Phytohalomonas tamaricis]|uniref:PP2C family protein-serine/threonine phosphatase n=1 Tax=Phytohalomonas tamaricis TaxID=2081032 RepID=UPI000D0B2477|nr:SpoIIE family protein phosphatase [Phytohalomonas tamaricis]
MPKSIPVIGLVDQPGADRDALLDELQREHLFDVIAVDQVVDLPEQLDGVVAHARVTTREQWALLANRCPTIMVSEHKNDADLLAAVDAGIIDYVIDPLAHRLVLCRLLSRALEYRRMALANKRDRERLEQLNEKLETHLALLRHDLHAGGQIQRKLLPPSQQQLNGVQGSYWLAPSLYLSGDYLDYQVVGERYTVFCFADVSGHGASSAFVTVLLKALFQRWQGLWNGRSPEALPARWLARINRELLGTGVGKHAALFIGVIDRETRKLHYSLGAQLPMPYLSANGNVTVLEGEGHPVGLFPDIEYPAYCVTLPEQFTLWLCSDGVLDCLPGTNLEERLEALRSRIAEADDIAAFRASLALADALPDDLTFMTLSGFDDG